MKGIFIATATAYLGFQIVKMLVRNDLIGATITNTEGDRIRLAMQKNGEIRDQYGSLWT